jgi:hypothetical protein
VISYQRLINATTHSLRGLRMITHEVAARWCSGVNEGSLPLAGIYWAANPSHNSPIMVILVMPVVIPMNVDVPVVMPVIAV